MCLEKLKCSWVLLFCLFTSYSFAQPIPLNQKYADSITSQLSKWPDDTAKVNNLATLGSMYILVNPALALQYARQGVAIAEKINYPVGKINCLAQSAFFYAFTGEWAKATADINEAIPLCDKYKPELLILMYNLMYINAATKEDDQEALLYAQKALHHPSFATLPEINKWPTYMQLGRTYQHLNMLDSAIYYSNILVDFKRKYNNVSADLVQNSNVLVGQIAAKQKDYPKAIQYYHLASDYAGLAEVYTLLNQRDSVIYYSTLLLRNGEVQKNFKLIEEAAKSLAAAYRTINPAQSNLYLTMYAAAKDSLYNNDKLKRLEAIKLYAQKNQFELEKSATATKNRYILYSLLGLLTCLFVFLLMLWRNNRFKKRANAKLEAAYTDLKSVQTQLIQSEKMASLGELTAGIAHEIQNPLNFVNNFADVNKELLEELKQEAVKGNVDEVQAIASDVIENSEKINYHGRRAESIVKGMLEHSRSSSGVKELSDINALADEYLRVSYQGLRNKDGLFNATLKTDFDTSIGKINIVPKDIGRLLLNLYNNAFYTVHQKQKQNSETYEPTVIVNTKKIGNKIEIKVTDNGNGIAKGIVEKIFQPFFTTKPTGQGTGLGLSLAYDIVKTHGGEIRVETKEDAGTSFIIILPTGL